MANEGRAVSVPDEAITPCISGGGGGTVNYKIIGWNTVGLTYEVWESAVTPPNLTPPVGPCNPIRISTTWIE